MKRLTNLKNRLLFSLLALVLNGTIAPSSFAKGPPKNFAPNIVQNIIRPTENKATALVDLHAHFFMPEASGFPFFGSFNDPLHASKWSSRLQTRVNAEALEQSNVQIAVVALYSHPLFFRSIFGSQRESIRAQIREAKAFVASHPNWVIAKTPAEARSALSEGRRSLILSIEGASGVLENEADIHEFVDTEGVRIVTPLHFIDDWIGGPSLMPWPAILVNPFAAFTSFVRSEHDDLGVLVNEAGITVKGRSFIKTLVEHGVWIDFSHASDASIGQMLPILKEAGQPVLYTHTILRSAYRAERGITDAMVREVANSGGVLGLLPSDDMLKGTNVPAHLCPTECNGQCEGGEAAYAAQYESISKTLPASHIFIGSDIDAPLNFLKPECVAMKKRLPQGYVSYAQLKDLYAFLSEKKLTPNAQDSLQSFHPENVLVEEFLKAWEKVRKPL